MLSNRTRQIFEIILSLGLFLLIWQMISIIMKSPLLPNPMKVVSVLFNLMTHSKIWLHIFASLKRTMLGFLVALVVGGITAYITSFHSTIKKIVFPWIELLRPIPPLAWIPLAILWFGLGLGSSVFIIFLIAFFPIFTEVHFGIKSIPETYHQISRNYQLTKMQKFKHIVLPYTVPYLLSSSKISIGLSWMAVVASEMISANKGLGYFIEIGRANMKSLLF